MNVNNSNLTILFIDFHWLPLSINKNHLIATDMRGALGYIRNRKTEEKIIQNRKNAKKFGTKPKTAYKTVKNRQHEVLWQGQLNIVRLIGEKKA